MPNSYLQPNSNIMNLSGMASTNPQANIAGHALPNTNERANLVSNLQQQITNVQGQIQRAAAAGYTAPGPNANKQIPNEILNPGVVSSSSAANKIPGMNLQLNAVADKGVRTDATTGISTTADGKPYTPPALTNINEGVTTADTSQEDAQLQANLDKMRSESDAVTAAEIAGIQDKYKRLKEQQQKINESTLSATRSALLMSGAAQHDVFSEDAVKMRMEQNLSKVQELDQEENDLINTAKNAQMTRNWKLLETANAQIEKKRQEKVDQAKKINEELIAANKVAREKQIQASRDNVIANLYSQGITDLPTILNYLNFDDQGNKISDFTAEEIGKTLKSIVPAGLDDLVKTLRQNNAPSDVISKVLASPDINSAYEAAGAYGAGGSGIVGEYNYYKAQEQAAGRPVMTFNEYQTADANRKAKASTTPILTTDENGNIVQVGNYDALTIGRYNKAANSATSILQKNPTFKNIIGSSAYLDRIEAAVKNPGSVGDQELLDAFTQLNTGGNRVTEAQVHLITSNQSLGDLLNKYTNKLKNGGALSDQQRQEIVKLSQEVYKNYQKSYKPLYDDAVKRLKAQGIPEEFWNIPSPDTLSRAVNNEEKTGDVVSKTEAEAQNQVDTAAKTDKTIAKIVYDQLSKPDPTLGRVMTYSEVLQYLQAIGKLK